MHFRYTYILCLLSLITLLPGCVKYRDLRAFNEGPAFDSVAIKAVGEYRLQTDDILSILIQSSDMLAAEPFNLRSGDANSFSNSAAMSNPGYSTQVNSGTLPAQGYTVDAKGMIQMPQLGSIVVQGLTLEELKKAVEKALQPFLKESLVTIRLLNYRVTILGEVTRPGTISFPRTKVSLLEALGMAGDLTHYAMRDSIMIIRELNGVRSTSYVDLHNRDFVASPNYYIQQNDLVYIPPTKDKRGAVPDNLTRNAPWIISAISTVALVLALFLK
ncbi:MAG: polysaccharide biosynthesis/export family protein [Saprospiraceae bacterium]